MTTVAQTRDSASTYYKRLREISIGDVAQRLLKDRITHDPGDGEEIVCDCPNHSSNSKKSLTITPREQRWYCFGCSEGGDVLQLVEFIQSGCVTKNRTGDMPESHRKARDTLGAMIGLPPLSTYGLTSGQQTKLERDQMAALRVLECLTAVADYYHNKLNRSPEVLYWFTDHYKLSIETIDRFKIGYADNAPWTDEKSIDHPGLVQHLLDLGYTDTEIKATGAFYIDSQDRPNPAFRKRITFPYSHHGRVHYMIARRTQWSDIKDSHKYRKLQIYNEHNCKYVNPVIQNALLFNEDLLNSKPDTVIITEGITDCLSGLQNNLPCISPVTTSIRKADWPRILPKLSSCREVYLVGDNEVSQAGLNGSLRTHAKLSQHHIDSRIVILPLTDEQRKAREEIESRWGIHDHLNRVEVADRRKQIPEGELPEYDALCEQAKVDLNSWFSDGGTVEDFLAAMKKAVTPLDMAIERLDPSAPADDLRKQREAILRCAAAFTPTERRGIANKLKEKLGLNTVRIDDLLKETQQYAEERKVKNKAQARKQRAMITAPEGTLQHAIQTTLADALEGRWESTQTHAEAGERAFQWLQDNGAKFYRIATEGGIDLIMFWGGQTFSLNPERNRRTAFEAEMYELTRLLPSETLAAKINETIRVKTLKEGRMIDRLHWLHTDSERFKIYFTLGNDCTRAVTITPEGVREVNNGDDDVLLTAGTDLEPITYVPGVTRDQFIKHLEDFRDSFACAPEESLYLVLWMSCFLLLDFSSTKPMARFEGETRSGKTAAFSHISTLIFGHPIQERITIAAAYAQSERIPFLLLDNIESEETTKDLKNFMLLATTGARNTKRSLGSDHGVTSEHPKCLLASSGIDALAGNKEEMQNRMFPFSFSREYRNPEYVLHETLNRIRGYRSEFLSYLFDKTAVVLSWIQLGFLRQAKSTIEKECPDHNKERSNEYLALMLLMAQAISETPTAEVQAELESLPCDFKTWIMGQHEEAGEIQAADSDIAIGLRALFVQYQNDCAIAYRNGNPAPIYPVEFRDNGRQVYRARGRDLLMALQGAYKKQVGTSFPRTSPITLGRRIKSNLDTLRAAGFRIEIENRQNSALYTIDMMTPGSDPW